MSMGVKMLSINRCKLFLKDDRGTNAVEFALLALPFFGLLLGVIQLGLIFLASQSLDEAVDNAAREIRTGQTRTINTAVNIFRTNLCDDIPIIMDCENNLQVSVQSFASFAETTSTTLFVDNNPVITGDYETGDGGDLVVISAAVSIPLVAGSLFGTGDGSGRTRLTTSLVFTNENFADLASADGG